MPSPSKGSDGLPTAIVRAMMEVPTERTPLAAAALMERRWSAASSIE
jgi:hypothetical protein